MDRFTFVSGAMTVLARGVAAGLAVVLLATVVASGQARRDGTYPPLRDYLMEEAAEVSLARSAAPANVSARATVKVLTESGYAVAGEGNNGFVCLVLRGWSAPTYSPPALRAIVYDARIRAPICFDPIAARTVLPYQELRTKLAMAGKHPDEITAGVEAAYARGELPRMETVAFAYMMSADMFLGDPVGSFHPHVMVYAPYYENALLGGNEWGGPLPFVSDDAGTPFAVTVIRLDHATAISAT